MDDHAISMEEIIIPDPFWEDLPPPPEPPLVVSDGFTDGVVTNGGGEGTGATDQNQSPSEWSFERLLEEELLIDATPLENFSGSAPHADTTVVDEVDRATTMVPAAVSTVGDPMEYNNILKRKLDEDLATVAMWRVHSAIAYPFSMCFLICSVCLVRVPLKEIVVSLVIDYKNIHMVVVW
jgi:hypothetical protein